MDEEQTAVRAPDSPTRSGERNGFLTVLSGRSVGQQFKLPHGTTVVGRSLSAQLRIDDDGVSRRHLRIEHDDNGVIRLVDLDSTNGTYVDGKRVFHQQLYDGDRIQLGSVTILKFSYQDLLEEQLQLQLYESATRDPLTQAYNKRFFEEQFVKDFSHARRHHLNLSLLMMDVDHFKQINDVHGHPAGDHVLQRLAACLLGSVRTEDAFCRIGGEEFVVIARNSPPDDAVTLAERLRRLVAETFFAYDGERIPVTISVGIACFEPDRHTDPTQLIEDADRWLYAAKRTGRNRVAGPSTAAGC